MSIFDSARKFLKDLQKGAAPIAQGVIDLPASTKILAQRLPGAINTLVMNPKEAGYLARTAPQYAQFKVPGFQTAANFSANAGQTFGQGLQNMAMGVNQVQNKPGVFNKITGGAKVVLGAGQTVSPFTGFFQGPNLITSVPQSNNSFINPVQRFSAGMLRGVGQDQALAPNVKNKNLFNFNLGGQSFGIDPFETAGQMVGFTKNPVNNQLFKLTEGLFKAGTITQAGNLKKWLAVTGLRGSAEGILLDIGKVPDNATPQEKLMFMAKAAGFGAASEIVGRGAFDFVGAGLNKAKSVDLTVKAFDELKDLYRRANIPVTTEKFDLDGNRVVEPMWRYQLAKQEGFIKPDEFIPKVKTQTQIKTETKGTSYKPDLNQKMYTQPGSYTNTREDQIAGKFRLPDNQSSQGQQAIQGGSFQPRKSGTNPQELGPQPNTPLSSRNSIADNFEAEMDALAGKRTEKTFTGKSKVKFNPTDISGDKASTDFATARDILGGSGFKGQSKEVQDSFQKWVNSRRASQVEGFLKKKEFKDLDSKGVKGIFEFQSGNKSGRYGDVKQYFDTKYAEVKKNGIEFDYRQDYLPQLWENTREEIEQVLGRRIGIKPSFTLEAVFKSYQEGIDAGLKPKFKNISDLTGWYEQKANKAIADKNFFDFLAKDSQIVPTAKAPQDWVTLDPDRFPKFLSQVGDEKFAGTYKAPEELAKIINNYLRDPQFEMLTKVANYVSRVKNITLNFGIPKTAINAHGVNILARHTLMGTGSNPINRFLTASKYMLYPDSAMKNLDQSMVRAPKAIKDGLTMSAEDYSGLGNVAENLAGQFSKKWESLFGVPLFNKMIPALKLSSYEELVKGGMNGKDAAKLANNVYGGINYEQMGRNKDFQNFLRSVILAPDWAESTVRIGGNFAKAANILRGDKVSRRYQAMMATVMASYVAHNITNKITSGHYSYENDPGHTFEIQVGTTDSGEKRYLRPYNTALDMVRLPYDVARGAALGDFSKIFSTIRNRTSIPLGVVIGAASDTNYRGQTIGYRGKDKYGNPMDAMKRAANIGGEAASLIGTPSFIRQLALSATGQQGLEEGLTQGFELPFRYSNTYKSKSDLIYDEFKKLKTPEEKATKWQELVKEGKITKYNQSDVIQKFTDEAIGVTKDEDKIRSLTVRDGERAKKVVEELNKLKTPEEKAALWKKYLQAKIMTPQVQEQVVYLLTNK